MTINILTYYEEERDKDNYEVGHMHLAPSSMNGLLICAPWMILEAHLP